MPMVRTGIAALALVGALAFSPNLEARSPDDGNGRFDALGFPAGLDEPDTMVYGCLRRGKTPDSFTLERRTRSYVVIGRTPDLRKHVGRRVQVTGTTVRQPNRRSDGSRRPPQLRANTIKVITASC